MRMHMKLASVLAAAAMLAACTTAPVDQIKHFSQAFSTLNTVGQPLLDDLAVAEKARGRLVAADNARAEANGRGAACAPYPHAWQTVPNSGGFIAGFCPADATYFSDLADPPATAALRGGLLVVERYAEILSALAENRNVDEALGQVDALAKNLSGLLAVVGVAAPLASALSPLKPLLERAARETNAVEARRLILEGTPQVSKVIGALRDAVPPMFRTLVGGSATRLTQADAATPAIAAPELARIEAYRKAVANYAVLLGKLQAAWDMTAAAAAAPANGNRTLVSLVEQTAQIKADAEAARQAFAALRTGAAER